MSWEDYTISMPVADIIEYTGLQQSVITELEFGVADWAHLRGNVSEGGEVVLVGSVPEEFGVIQLRAVVTEFDDKAQRVRVII